MEKEIAEAVADRPSLVHLDAPGHVWAGAEKCVGARVDARLREWLQKLVRRVEVPIGLVAVNAHEHEAGVAPGDSDGVRQSLEIRRRRVAQHVGPWACDERVAQRSEERRVGRGW